MKELAIYRGPSYLFTVLPSEEPYETLMNARAEYGNRRLRLVEINNGIPFDLEGSLGYDDEEEYDDFEDVYDDDEFSDYEA